ncbi:hypothetical protein [Pseudotenacibaculum haliotis]|uniref:Uncharacterized protein n=1 Tax=Pseudotenacibaculum haliotis TaxID=1862138 RepID=A0ABW5LQY6_9FLAO
MKFLQIMPTEETFLQSDLGFIISISLILIAVIVVFDKYRGFVNWILKKNS